MSIAEIKSRTKDFSLSEIDFYNTSNITVFEKIQTPFYFYDIVLLHKTLRNLRDAAAKHNYQVHYAIKANANDKILNIIKEYLFGADCVSGNEIKKAVLTGFQPQKIVFAGVGKTDKEINTAIENNILCFNCESCEEIIVINQLAKEKNMVANIAFRINPEIDAGTHPYITTGIEITKFGMSLDDVKWIINQKHLLNNINIVGIHFHIGSQITNLSVYKNLCEKANEVLGFFNDLGLKPKYINMGGGLGVDYQNPENNIPDFDSFFNVFKQSLNVEKHQVVLFELGRSIVASCGKLITKVLYIKNRSGKSFAIVDAGFTELIRPSLYNSFHKITNLSSNESFKKYDVVGPICETTDCFGKSISLSSAKRGDLLIIHTTGAYGEVMSSHYNLRDSVKSYYSDSIQ